MEEKTVQKHYNNLKWFLNWAIRKGYCDEESVNKFRPKFKVLDKPVIFLTKEELLKLYTYEIPKNGTKVKLVKADGEEYEKTVQEAGALLNQKELKYRESLEDFNKLVSDNPRDVSYLKARATLAVEMNTPDLALLDLEEAAKLAPDDAEIYVMCGEIYLSQKKKREAYVAFEKAIELGVPRPELQDKLKASK